MSRAAVRCEGHECGTRQAEPRDGGRHPGRPVGGNRLCAACHRRLTTGIGMLPELYRDCERVLGGAAAKGLRERTSGGPLPGMPFNPAAAETRAAILGVLGSWSGLIAQQRGLVPPERSVGTLSVFLLRHADWLAGHPAVAEATREVARLVSRARRVAHPEQIRRIALGDCVEPGCEGRLSAVVRVGATAAHPAVQCDAQAGHTWAGHQLTHLRRLMPAEDTAQGTAADTSAGTSAGPAAVTPAVAERWLTAADISRLWSTPVGTVYRLASEQSWRRRHGSGRTYYSEADAHACFSRRAERSAERSR
ncbi:hypothetical protein ACIOC1_11745 [Streptomyces sp. NPDC088197]|uniref:hypothetical protein n=1 Tax=Streptomyces sp. NPDC088197 TaxID=3365840 RepID=UPI0037FC25ED